MPIPLIPEHRDRTRCRWMLCHNEGTKECIGCIGATPRAKYCSRKCQTQDWSFHKKYCGKKVYTFKIKLLGSKDPVIKRTVDVPAWFTFQELHFVIQYAFGPWQQYHQHQFSFHSAPPGRGGATHMAPDTELLRVIADEDEHNEAYRVRRLAVLKEKEVRLFDVYGSEGRHRAQVDVYGDVLPMIYTYDFKDNWKHLVTFVKERAATVDRPLFSKAQGYPPAEDVGGIAGWEKVKKAFAAQDPTRYQLELRRWAIQSMGYENRNDPLAVGDVPYSPFNKVNVEVMNYEGRWENHYTGYSGVDPYAIPPGDDLDDLDDFDEEEGEEDSEEQRANDVDFSDVD